MADSVRRRFRGLYGCLGWRLVVLLTGSLLLLLGASGWLALEMHRQHLYSLLRENAVGMGETILFSTHFSMLKNDQEHLAQIIENIGQRESVVAIRLVDAQGLIKHSSHASEVGERLDTSGPLCQGCHSGSETLAPKNLQEGLRLYSLPGGEHALGLGVPVLNTTECSNGSCHVHPPNQRVLGMLDLELSTLRLDQAMTDARHQMAGFGLLTVLLISGAMGILAWRVVHRPMHTVLDGIRRLGSGDLSHRITQTPSGELGELAESFNVMSGRLESAQEKLEEWNQGLEARIAEKTRELEHTRDQMVFTEKMASLGKLAAIVAHEINNPLAGILVYTKLVRRRLEKLRNGEGSLASVGDLEETLTTMEEETARCGDIVRNLLLFSRRRETAQGPGDINTVLAQAMKLVQHKADLAGVTVNFDLAPDLPPAHFDAAEIEQAALSLIMNALEAMAEGGSLTLSTCYIEDRDQIRIDVADTGIGIPDELRSRVFEPFFSTKEEGKGTGLGMAVLYGIMQRHQGYADFESRPGEGTTFHLYLPVGPTDSDPVPAGGTKEGWNLP